MSRREYLGIYEMAYGAILQQLFNFYPLRLVGDLGFRIVPLLLRHPELKSLNAERRYRL